MTRKYFGTDCIRGRANGVIIVPRRTWRVRAANAPCLIQRVTRRDELEIVASGDVQHNPDRYLKTRRPPLLKDYFDHQLRKVAQVARENRLVRVQFGCEQLDVPAT